MYTNKIYMRWKKKENKILVIITPNNELMKINYPLLITVNFCLIQ